MAVVPGFHEVVVSTLLASARVVVDVGAGERAELDYRAPLIRFDNGRLVVRAGREAYSDD